MREGDPTHQQAFRCLEASLRLCVIPLCVASIWVTARNKQVDDEYGKVEFTNISGLRYLVWIDAVSAGYALAAVGVSFLRRFASDWIFFALDQVIAYLTVTSGSAVAELLYLAREGDRMVSWSEVCSYYGRFCYGIQVSLALQFMVSACFIALSLISAYRVFSKFEAPSVASKEVGDQGEF